MAAVTRAYLAVLNGMAWVAAAMLVATMVLIVYWVVWRNLGLQPSSHAYTLVQYAMLFIPMLGAPWLVRKKGHVRIEILTAALPERGRRVAGRVAALLCVVACGLLAWYALQITLKDFERNAMDVRSWYFPRWTLMTVMPVSFGMMTVEFGRFLLGFDELDSEEPGAHG